jgi:hypothetical protein
MQSLGSWRARLLVLLLAALSFAGWRWLQADAATQEQAAATPTASAPLVQTTATAPYSAAGLIARQRLLDLWQLRHERAEQVYLGYRDATRYPPEARPIAEHPDQMRPFAPVQEEMPLRDATGKPLPGLRIRSTQDRVFVSGSESARFTLEALDGNGRTVPLAVRRSAAQSLPDGKGLVQLVRSDVAFTDDGAGADDVPGDGRYAGRLTPALQGFGSQAGTIRLLVEVVANGEQGMVGYDVVYLPEVPGTWSGVREALENGALNFYLKAQVRSAGRYVASARVSDANGVPFALLQFNEQLPAGAVELRLSLPGLLVRDKAPAFPLQVVDVEAFLLKPDTYPDRAMMPRLAGLVHVSKAYPLESFSAEEWNSEERNRYLAEYARDVVRAEEEMARLRR